MKPISEETRSNILSLLDKGLSSRQIEAQLNVGHITIHKVREEARPDMQKSQGGRPAKLTAADTRWLVRHVTSGKADNAAQLTREFFL
jgi:transposase